MLPLFRISINYIKKILLLKIKMLCAGLKKPVCGIQAKFASWVKKQANRMH
jgi:hypothetical protein